MLSHPSEFFRKIRIKQDIKSCGKKTIAYRTSLLEHNKRRTGRNTETILQLLYRKFFKYVLGIYIYEFSFKLQQQTLLDAV